MEPDKPTDAFARLAPTARAPERARRKIGVGAAVVLLIAALVVAVVVTAVGQQTGQVVEPGGGESAGSGSRPGSGSGSGDTTDPGVPPTSSGPGGILFIHVLGAVRRPGLFELPDGARVIDVVAAAGGLAPTADPAGVNLARLVSDGEQLYIPRLGEAQPGAPPGAAGPGRPAGVAAGGKINLNSATTAELETLPRIGPAMAQRIIDFREANGRFANIEDLRNVTGIGDKTFDGLKELITT